MRVLFLIFLVTSSAFARGKFFDTSPILQLDHSVLKQVAQEVDPQEIETTEFQNILHTMLTTMERNGGFGMAASQINMAKKIFIFKSFNSRKKIHIMINPDVEYIGDLEKISTEQCLSTFDFGNQLVPRYSKVFVKYFNENGDYLAEEFSGLSAIAIQHLNDHLLGTLITDYNQNFLYQLNAMTPVQIPFVL